MVRLDSASRLLIGGMPELPEVETVFRGLQEHLIARRIERVEIFKPLVLKSPQREIQARLEGKSVQSVSRHGKSLFVQVEGPAFLNVHLGMTGALLFRLKDHPVDPYVRLIFRLDHPLFDLFYRDVRQFGKVRIAKQPYEKNWGPDAWNAGHDQIAAALKAKSGMIKRALLNQSVIAGLGNIYVDEALFRSKIHPKRKLEKLSKEKLALLQRNIRDVLAEAIGAGGTSFRDYVNSEGKRGEFKIRLRAYGQQGKPCVNCGTAIKKIVVASRGTHFCPRCQK